MHVSPRELAYHLSLAVIGATLTVWGLSGFLVGGPLSGRILLAVSALFIGGGLCLGAIWALLAPSKRLSADNESMEWVVVLCGAIVVLTWLVRLLR